MATVEVVGSGPVCGAVCKDPKARRATCERDPGHADQHWGFRRRKRDGAKLLHVVTWSDAAPEVRP